MLLALAPFAATHARAQTAGTLTGRVIDETDGSAVAEAVLLLREVEPGGAGWRLRRTTSGADGAYLFAGLTPGRYRLSMERLGYRTVTLLVTLERTQPLSVSILAEPLPFPLDAIAPGDASLPDASLVPHAPGAGQDRRAAAVRSRQERFLAADALQLDQRDVREANTLVEDDILRAFQRAPGVASRDDYAADLWTRGASAGQTVIRFDGVPLLGGLHALGVLGGPNSDMLASATFQPGVTDAGTQGGGAAVVDVVSRSPANSPRGGTFALSPLSARMAVSGRPSERVSWALGARRSYIDALSSIGGDVTPGDGPVPYAFADVTGRVDVALGHDTRAEASVYWQDDRVFGDVAPLARGNEGAWGSKVARASVITTVGGLVVRSTLGLSTFDASLRPAAADRTALHPATENHRRTVMATLDAAADAWSLGVQAERHTHEYDGPGIDLASLLSADELTRRGIPELTPIILGLERARLQEHDAATRVALWGERRLRPFAAIVAAAGLRVETGDPVAGSAVRLAPRLLVRYHAAGSPLSISAGWGRTWQYTQSVARSEVLRSGLRANEVLVQADGRNPALRSDLVTLGAELWRGTDWLLGANAWLRAADGILIPLPTPGAIDGPRPPVAARGSARGLELSARRLEGAVRGFANYSLSWSWHHTGTRTFPAPEDRRHVGNLGLIADVSSAVELGATWRVQSGAPYTRITLVDATCASPLPCDAAPAVLFGTPGGQRAPAYASLDLSGAWTHVFRTWSLSIYGQLRNALGSANEITYHSSCICVRSAGDGDARLGDRFDRGLPRLPVLGVRARF